MSDDESVIVGGSRAYHRADCYYAGRVWKRHWKGYKATESASFCAALDGLSPCESCNPPHDPDWENLAGRLAVVRRIEGIDVAVMRRMAVTMLDRIFGPDGEKRALKARVLDLSRHDRIPTDVANCLHMISDLRNMAEHAGELTELQAMIARPCWLLVKEWSATQIAQGSQIGNGGS
jgi:hypothetical protein